MNEIYNETLKQCLVITLAYRFTRGRCARSYIWNASSSMKTYHLSCLYLIFDQVVNEPRELGYG